MNTMARNAVTALDLGCCDALVIGGGLSGWSAAVTLARRGHDVLMAAQRTSPGHEIWGALSLWWPRTELGMPALWEEIVGELDDAGATRGTMVDPVATQVALERAAERAGVRMLVQVRAHPAGGDFTRLSGKWGSMAAASVVVIDATPTGRFASEAGAEFADRETDEPVVMRALMVKTGVTEPRRVQVGQGLPLLDGTVAAWPGVWSGDVIVEAELTLPAEGSSVPDVEAREALAEIVARLRAADEDFAEGSLAHIAHDPVPPRRRVLVGSDDDTFAAEVECDDSVREVGRGDMLPVDTAGLVVASPAIELGTLSMRSCQHAPNAVRLGVAAAEIAVEMLEGECE